MKNISDKYNNETNYPQSDKMIVYFYETKKGGGRGLVVACAKVDNIDIIRNFSYDFIKYYLKYGAINGKELLHQNGGNVKLLYAYWLSDVKELVEPVKLLNPPQSFCYTFRDNTIIMSISPIKLKKILAGEKTVVFKHKMPKKWKN
ncbi:MAG: hypothetical protein PHW22_04585 [Bacilli bacterium]|nr:hypothetical protein [Bacilli bacterium]